MSKKEVSRILEYGIYIIIILQITLGFLFFSIYEGIGMIIGALVIVYCANKNEEWASKIDRDVNLAFVFGIVFGLFGLLVYWILYKIRINNPTPESKTNKVITSFFLTIIILIGGIEFGIDLIDRTYEIDNEPYTLYEYNQLTPIPFATAKPHTVYSITKQISSFDEYDFSFDYPSDMIILKEGYLSENPNKNSGTIYITKGADKEGYITFEENFKCITINWLTTTDLELFSSKEILKENIYWLTNIKEEGYKITDIKIEKEIEIAKSNHCILYQKIYFRNYGMKEYAMHGCWYCEENQQIFYIFVESFDEKETEKLFNNFLDSFICQPIQIPTLKKDFNQLVIDRLIKERIMSLERSSGYSLSEQERKEIRQKYEEMYRGKISPAQPIVNPLPIPKFPPIIKSIPTPIPTLDLDRLNELMRDANKIAWEEMKRKRDETSRKNREDVYISKPNSNSKSLL